MNRHYLDPLLLGRYPEELRRDLRRGVARALDAEAGALRVPLDWLGVNYYTRSVVAPRPQPLADRARRACASSGAHPHRDRLGGLPATVCSDVLRWVRRPLRHAAALRHRKRRRLLRPADRRRRQRSRTRYASPTCASTCARSCARHRRGRRRARLLRLVAARQLRVGARLLASASASSTSTSRPSSARSRRVAGTMPRSSRRRAACWRTRLGSPKRMIDSRRLRPGALEMEFDPEADGTVFRRVSRDEDWLAVLEECPVPMDDLTPWRREVFRSKLRAG